MLLYKGSDILPSSFKNSSVLLSVVWRIHTDTTLISFCAVCVGITWIWCSLTFPLVSDTNLGKFSVIFFKCFFLFSSSPLGTQFLLCIYYFSLTHRFLIICSFFLFFLFAFKCFILTFHLFSGGGHTCQGAHMEVRRQFWFSLSTTRVLVIKLRLCTFTLRALSPAHLIVF